MKKIFFYKYAIAFWDDEPNGDKDIDLEFQRHESNSVFRTWINLIFVVTRMCWAVKNWRSKKA